MVMIDESGTDGQSSVLTMAALLAVELRWAHLEAEWRAMLERHGLDAIHCSQLRHQLGYDEARVAQLMRDVEAIILRHVPVSVVGVMRKGDYDQIYKLTQPVSGEAQPVGSPLPRVLVVLRGVSGGAPSRQSQGGPLRL
jgi:hypothetical protein